MTKVTIPIAKPLIRGAEQEEVRKVLASGRLAQGPMVAKFERKFAGLCRTKYAVAVNSGTAALHCALYACGIKRGDEVITTPFTFVATANAILMQGAVPIFADIDPLTFNLDPQKTEEKLTKKTKGILPVDLYGHIYDVPAIKKLAKKHKLKIIEDACQACGAEFRRKRAGAFGDVGCFSFYATKNMTTGEGGMLVTNNKRYAELARRFRHHGQGEKTRYRYFDLGFNYRLTDIMAAIGLEQLKALQIFNRKRRQNANRLNQGLKGIKGLVIPTVKKEYKHVFHQYTIRITSDFGATRGELRQSLTSRGIGTAVFYPQPLHLHPHFRKLGYQRGNFPVAEKASREVLSLPVHPSLADPDIELIINTIQNHAKRA